MRKLFSLSLLLLSLTLWSQPGHKLNKKTLHHSIISDSAFLELKKQKDSPRIEIRDTNTWENKNREGFNALLRQQEANRARQKRWAYIRIGIGLVFLAIIIVGLSRRRKNSRNN